MDNIEISRNKRLLAALTVREGELVDDISYDEQLIRLKTLRELPRPQKPPTSRNIPF